MQYQLLYVKSNYSLLSSLLTIKDIITFHLKEKRKYAVLCDDTMYGTMEFIKECEKVNLKPVIGLEIHVEGYDILAYAKNYQGYLHLIKLSTLQNTSKVTKEDIITYRENIIFILPFASKDYFNEYKDIITELYLGYSTLEEERISKEITEQVIFLRKCLYNKEEDKKYLPYLYAIRDGKTISEEIKYDIENKALTIPNITLYSDEAGLKNTVTLLEECEIIFPNAELLLPLYDCPNGVDSITYLKKLSSAGLYKRLTGKVDATYQKRLDYELDVICKMGFANYFLIVYDFIRYAKNNHILVGPGRGSAAGSLVAYSLGITEIDPIKYDLLFERFLNPERVSMPDIDTDLPDLYRQDVIDYVTNKYGKKRVCGIVTFSTLAAKQVIRDIGRVLNIPLYKIDRLNSYIPAMSKNNLDYFYHNNLDFRNYLLSDPTLQQVYSIATVLEGFPRQIGTHAAGIVMCQKDLDEVLPLTISDDMYLTSYSMNYLEELGLLKMDFLGIKNLTLIMNVLHDIKATTGEELNFNLIPLNDEAVYQLFQKAETTGIFQFESSGMRNFLRQLKPSNFEDIVAAIALFRPGPASNIDTYIARKEKRQEVIYLDPILKPILEKTYGIMIYQEQIMQVAHVYAGYTLGEADILRRAISKKKLDVLEKEETKFISKVEQLGRDKKVAKELFSLILKFAGYGFNRSHAVAYSMVAYKMAYLKVHYEVPFYANLLNNVIGSDAKTKEYLNELRSHHITVLKPSINKSTDKFVVLNKEIIFPFSSIKGIGITVSKTIMEARKEGPFKDLFDAFSRLIVHRITKKQLETLTLAGCFDEFGYTKRTIIESLDILINYGELTKDLDPSLVFLPELEQVKEYENVVLLEQEYNCFGFYISNHPTTVYLKQFPAVIPINQISYYFNKVISLFVMIEKIKVISTKKGEEMAFITGSDETGVTEFVFFPRIYKQYSNLVKGNLCVINGRVEKRLNELQIVAQKVEVIKENSK